MAILGNDTFVRANQSGWGAGTDTQSWATVLGSATLSIVSNKGRATGNTILTHVFYGSSTSVDQEVVARFTPSTNGPTWGVILRATGSNVCYRVRCNGAQLNASYDNAGTNTILTNTLTFAVTGGTTYWIRGRINGSTIYGKIWTDGTAEPAAWSIINTDTNITVAGQYGIATKGGSAGDTVDVDKFYAANTVFDDIALTPTDSSSDTLVQNATDTPTITETVLWAETLSDLTLLTSTDTLASVISGNLYLLDTFQRANSAGNWGALSDVGGPWLTSAGGATPSLVSNKGTLTGSTVTTTVTAPIGTSDTELLLHFSSSSATDQIAGLIHQNAPVAGYYFAGVDGAGNFVLGISQLGTPTILATTAFSYSASTGYLLRFRQQGTTLQAKLWIDSVAEPVAFALSATNGVLGQYGGAGVQVTLANAGDTAYIDYISVTSLNFMLSEVPLLSSDSTLNTGAFSYLDVPISIVTPVSNYAELFYLLQVTPDLGLYGLDTFSRPDRTEWGAASDIGGQWYTITTSLHEDLAIVGNTGQISGGNTNFLQILSFNAFSDGEVLVYASVTNTTDKVGAVLRCTSPHNYYDINYNNGNIHFAKVVNNAITILSSTAVSVTAGNGYWLRARAQGPNFAIKWWDATTVEPVAFNIDGIVDTDIPGPGCCGVVANPGPTDTCSFSNFAAYSLNFLLQCAYQDQVAVGYNDQSDVPV